MHRLPPAVDRFTFAGATSLTVLFFTIFLFTQSVQAQPPATGTLQGRVFDAGVSNQRFLENARVTIAGTDRQVFTDRDGWYRFTQVPVGVVKVQVHFTGLEPQIAAVPVAAEGITQHDIGLSIFAAKRDKEDSVVKMDAFGVSESREMSNALIAINEERFSPNLRTIVGTDEFGVLPSDDMGELMKFMPGLAMLMTDGEPAAPNIDGVGAENIPVTVGGFDLTSATQNTSNRDVRMTHLSLNNFSRVEIVRSPTPESPGNALAGTVNLVPRSAFERARAVLSFSTYLTMRADEADLHKTEGPRYDSWKALPGFDFSYVVPVNHRLGFSISGNLSESYKRRDFARNTWRGSYTTTNGGTYPHTTADNPYLTAFNVRDGQLFSKRQALAMTLDYKLTPFDQLSLSISDSRRNSEYDNRALVLSIASVPAGSFSSRFTHSPATTASLQIDTEDRNYDNRTFIPTLTYRHNGPVWKLDAGTAYSNSTAHTRGPDKGYTTQATMRRTGVAISFDDVGELGPGRITVKDSAGNAIDPFDLNNYALTAANFGRTLTTDVKRTAFGNASRTLDAFPFPVLVKSGFRLQYSKRDLDNYPGLLSNNTTFVGADGVSSTTPAGDDDAGPYAWEAIRNRMGAYGYPAVPTIDIYQVYDLFKAKPAYFTENAITRYDRITGASRVARELISAGYLQGEMPLLGQRLRLIGGVRFEQTNIKGSAAKQDPTANYQRDASGHVVRNSSGSPVLIHPAGSLEARQLIYTRRGSNVKKEYLNSFPSLNAIYRITENLQLHGAWFTSIGRPSFAQYAGAVTMPDLERDPSSSNRFTLSNVGIKPWTAKTATVALEYYFRRSGKVSLSAFRRDIRNFFGSTVIRSTPAFLSVYGLEGDNSYLDYDVATQYNLPDTVRMQGLTFAYKQALTFLPNWARGVSVFLNYSHQNNQGDRNAEFAVIPNYGGTGIGITRTKWSANLNYTWRDDQYQDTNTGTGIAAGTIFYVAAQGSLDLSASYRLNRNFSLVAKLTDLLDEDHKQEYYNASTPRHARLRQVDNWGGGVWTFSLQGTF